MRKLLFAILLSFPVILVGQSSRIPTPESEFGFAPGADYKLANYEQVIGYFQKVDAVSDRMMMVQAGKTTQGRVYQFALISSRSNLSRIDRYLEIARRLAHPEGLTDDEAKKLAHDGKAFVHIDGGLHASEIAGPQQMPQLLYDLLTRADSPEFASIFDNVIFMLWPTINPDGMTMVTDWYMSHVQMPDASGQAPPTPGLPTLYQEYVGHDNNRDAYMLNMIESRVMEHAWRQWEPDIVYVMHQAPPNPYRIWLPPFAEPIATHAPPIPSAEVNMIGMAIAQGLNQHNQPGAVHMLSTYDAWYPGYIDYNPIFKNIPSFWTETAGPSAAPSRVGNILPELQIPHALYVNPFPAGEWHLRDAVAYDETAAISVLQYAAKYKEELLYGRYQSGRDQIKKGRAAAPYAYVIAQNQRDPVAPVELLRRLAFSGVRVYQLTSSVSLTERRGADLDIPVEYATGTWIVPTDQEFAALAREVLDVQKYPDVRESSTGPIDLPYDAAGWTLPLQMGVRVSSVVRPLTPEIRGKMRLLGSLPDPKQKPTPYNLADAGDAAVFDSVPGIGFDTNPAAAAIVPRDGRVIGSGPALAVDPSELNAFRAVNRAWKAGLEVQFAPAASATGAKYLISGLSEQDQDALVKSLALSAQRTNPTATPMKKPRIALLNQPNSMDEGWTRWVLEQYGFEFVRLPLSDVGVRALRDKIDVLILSDDARIGGAGGGRGGGGGGGRGAADAPPMPPTEARIAALDAFVKDGGTVVCFNRSATAVIDDLHLPVKNVLAGLQRDKFFVGGSLLQITTDPTQRVMAGMPEQAAVFFDSGPAFETQEGFKGNVLATYQSDGTPLLSGYLLGEKYLQGKVAALDVEVGNGHVILLGFRPQWRGQPFGTFRIIFNAAIYAR